jgi:hypothetical protein
VGSEAPLVLIAGAAVLGAIFAQTYKARPIFVVSAGIGAGAFVLSLLLAFSTSTTIHNPLYGWITDVSLFLLLGVFAVLLVGVPCAAIVQSVRALLRHSWVEAGKCMAVPLAGFCLSQVATKTNEILTMRYAAPMIQRALADVKAGKTLPRQSQVYPVAVYRTNPDVAAYALEGPLFAASYIAYDTADHSEPEAAYRLAKEMDGSSCSVSANQIWASYYWVDEAC